MFSFRRSLIALVSLLVIVVALATLMPLVGRGQGQTPFAQRKFYLTQTTHNGSQALSACAPGYHMASLWEIFDTSNLKYDAQLGFTRDDSGLGPPAGGRGWIRTGSFSSGGQGESPSAGGVNCEAWTSANSLDFGTTVRLETSWGSSGVFISPWFGVPDTCNITHLVWCVQD